VADLLSVDRAAASSPPDNGSADGCGVDGGLWFQGITDIIAVLEDFRRWRRRSRFVAQRPDEAQM